MTDRNVHLAHCYQEDYAGSCKYGEADCPAARQSLAREPATADVERDMLAYTYMRSGGRCDWRQLREAVSEAIRGNREVEQDERSDIYTGHRMVEGMNYNSLDRIVTAFVDAALSRANPSSEPAIAEGEEHDWMEMARVSAASIRPRSTWAKAVMKGARDESDEVRAAMAAIAATCAALAQSSTPPASKGVEALRLAALRDANEISDRIHADKYRASISDVETLRNHVRRLCAPTPSTDTLQGRGE